MAMPSISVAESPLASTQFVAVVGGRIGWIDIFIQRESLGLVRISSYLFVLLKRQLKILLTDLLRKKNIISPLRKYGRKDKPNRPYVCHHRAVDGWRLLERGTNQCKTGGHCS
jgi:hypothetical protein